MNLVGHAHVSVLAGRSSDDEVLGAVLPDLATMAGVRFRPAGLPAGVAAGVRAHHRADAAFHAHPAFLAGVAAIRAGLEAADVAPGAARAVGHVGFELLLDGGLLGGPGDTAFRRALAHGSAVVGVLPDDEQPRFAGLLHHWSPDVVLRYDDPAWVGRRLQHILGGRPRLRLDPDRLDDVVAVLRSAAPEVEMAGPALLATAVAAVEAG